MDASEFRKIVEDHERMVYSIALRIARDRGTAEEVAQDVFVELYRAADKIQGPEHLRFWLRRVAVHRATDALRRFGRQPEMLADPWREEHHSWSEPASAPLSNGVAHRLETMVGTLPEAMRIPIVLRYGEDMTPDEIGLLLQQPVATVKSNLQRGLKLLRQKAAVTLKEHLRERA